MNKNNGLLDEPCDSNRKRSEGRQNATYNTTKVGTKSKMLEDWSKVLTEASCIFNTVRRRMASMQTNN